MTELLADVAHQIAALAHTVASALPPDAAAAAAEPAKDAAPHAPQMAAWFESLLPYGPWAIFVVLVLSGVGLHVSEDFILIPAGFFAAFDKLPLWETLILAYFGLIIGDAAWVWVCRRFGTRIIQTRWFKRMVHPKRLLQAKHQMEARGAIVLILARFIPGTRTPVVTMAGLLHMPWWKFLAVEFTTVAITVPLQTGIGYFIGKQTGAESTLEIILWLLGLLALTVAVMLAIHWIVQARAKRGTTPRSKVSWLRTFGRSRKRGTAQAISPSAS